VALANPPLLVLCFWVYFSFFISFLFYSLRGS
jgi:hypothetical protein